MELKNFVYMLQDRGSNLFNCYRRRLQIRDVASKEEYVDYVPQSRYSENFYSQRGVRIGESMIRA
jgi:hypothetical protein